MKGDLAVLKRGRIGYEEAFELQKKVVEARSRNEVPDTLILLEHDPVLTYNRRVSRENILASLEALEQNGIKVCRTNRGGDVTYHGPGQLVGYPILDLKELGKDLHRYVFRIEEVIIHLLEDYGITSCRLDGYPGVWVEGEKIAAVGIAVNRQWITMHGFSLNVDPDMDHFEVINPCGIVDKGVTSLARVLGRHVDIATVKEPLIRHFSKIFSFKPRTVAGEDVLACLRSASLRGVDP